MSGDFIVSFDDNVDNIRKKATEIAPVRAEIIDSNQNLNLILMNIPEGPNKSSDKEDSKPNAIKTMEAQDNVKYVEENRKESPLSTNPDDPLISEQGEIVPINAREAWKDLQGSSNVTIAIIDFGIQYDHEDLAGNMDDSVSNHGRDFVNDDSDPYPPDFDWPGAAHGTSVGGIAGAVTDNGVGIAGVSDCSILSVHAGTSDGLIDGWAAVNGIEWAADIGADIINMSFGGEGEWPPYGDAIEYAESQGAITIGSAGNDGEEFQEYGPASQAHLAISATEGEGSFSDPDTLADFSNYGEYIDVAAPGTRGRAPDIENTENPDAYRYFAGTSMSAPVASGIAGLVLSVDESLTVTELKNILTDTATDIGLSRKKQGAGRVDAHAAVEAVADSLTVSATGDTIPSGGTAQIKISTTGMKQIQIQDIWTDWTVTSIQTDGAELTKNITDQGILLFSWGGVRNDKSVSTTFEIPKRYVGGTYEITITATKNNKTRENIAKINIK